MQTPRDRLMTKVRIEKNGCWTWTGAKGPKGTGAIRVDGKVTRPQRLSYYLFHGPIPEGRYVQHSCENPLCISPDHLYLTGRERQSDKSHNTLLDFSSDKMKKEWAADTYDTRALKRMMEKVEVDEATGCWMWTGAKTPRGYPKTFYKGAYFGAHRLMYFLEKGNIPEGLNVCHDCDTPLCINPDHLFTGTQKDNLKDMTDKGRRSQGKSHGKAIVFGLSKHTK